MTLKTQKRPEMKVIAGQIDTSIHKETNHEAMYQFTHIKTGKKYITQNWAEFYAYQADSRNWYQTYKRLGTADILNAFNIYRMKGVPQESRQVEDKLNKFWAGAKGYEKYGCVSCTGVCGIPVRWFLKNMRNHAAMVGDKDLYNKAIADDKWFYSNGEMTRLALPPHQS